MVFNSLSFIIFFPIVCVLYFALPAKYRWLWLLAASYYFYMCWNIKYSLLMLISTIITYASGRLIDTSTTEGRKRLWLALSFISNLSILMFFKYSGFVIDNINRLSEFLGGQAVARRFDILLPVGISFYTFQALSYTADVYRGQIRAEKNFLRYALYVSFFPQLVAGPIERSTNLLPQMRETHRFDWNRMRNGLYLMMWGYFEKVVVADRVAVVVDTVFNSYSNYSGIVIAGAVVLFAIQIYCDFGGYSHIAIGAAEIMGFRLMDNFRQPYFATSVQEFWRRWHISLSTWFKDYLYIPLGGNRKGKFRQKLNLLITFLVSGLWHGAGWHFIVWGGVNGLFQIIGNYKNQALKKLKMTSLKEKSKVIKFMRIGITFCLITFTWLFFRAENMTQAIQMIRWTLSPENTTPFSVPRCLSAEQYVLALMSIFAVFVVDILHECNIGIREQIGKNYTSRALGACAFLIGTVVILTCGAYGLGYDAAAFIYFQF